MATDASQSFKDNSSTKTTQLSIELDWKLINIEPLNDRFWSDNLCTSCKDASCFSCQNFVFKRRKTEPCCSYEPDISCQRLSSVALKLKRRKTEDEESVDSDLDVDWRLINVEPRAQVSFVCSEERNVEDDFHLTQPGPSRVKSLNSCASSSRNDWRLINVEPTIQVSFVSSEEREIDNVLYFAQPGPSRVKSQNNCASSNLMKDVQNEWNLTGTEPHYSQISSTSRQENYELPGPSRTKAYSTILKKPCPERTSPDYLEDNLLFQSEWNSTPDPQSSHLDNENHCMQFGHLMKQPTEKESHKRVHFQPRSECELLYLCDTGHVGNTSGTKHTLCEDFDQRYPNDDEWSGFDELDLIGWTKDTLLPCVLQPSTSDAECNKDINSKTPTVRYVSAAVKENASANDEQEEDDMNGNMSANNNPEDDEPNALGGLTVHQDKGTDAKQQTPLTVEALENPGNKGALGVSSRVLSSVDQPSKPLVGDSENLGNTSDENHVFNKIEERPSNTEEMVALFANLHIKENSLPLQNKNSKRGKASKENVADDVLCFDERITRQVLPVGPDKTQKAESSYSGSGSILQPCNSVTLCQQTSHAEMINLEHIKDQTRTFSATKESVDAVLFILKSMQISLVHMANATNAKPTGNKELNDSLKDMLTMRRKTHAWESADPKDSEVMPDGLFAYSIAHQVIGHVFRKITELNPTCAQLLTLDIDQNRDSMIAALALTAMKDALKELEGHGVNIIDISKAEETSDSLMMASTEDKSDDQDILENKDNTSESIVLDIINEVINHIIDDSLNVQKGMNKTDERPLSRCRNTVGEDSINAELKHVSFELVSKIVGKAVYVITNSRPQSMNDTVCDRAQALPVPDMDACCTTNSVTDSNIQILGIALQETHTAHGQLMAYLVQCISNEMYCLVTKLFGNLDSADCREKLNILVPYVKIETVDKMYEQCNKLVEDLKLAKETIQDILERTQPPQMSLVVNTFDSVTHKEEEDTIKEMKKINNESQSVLSSANNLSCSTQSEECSAKDKWNALFSSLARTSQETKSEHSTFGEPCLSNESTKCINSSSQTNDSSMERLFDWNIESPGFRLTFESQHSNDTSSQETFEYSTPSILLGMQNGESSREGNIFGRVGFGRLHIAHSSDIIPATMLQMTGGNHPEHVKQADQNRPSCSGTLKDQGKPQIAEKILTSKSMTTAPVRRKKPVSSDNTSYAPCHNQTRFAKIVGNLAGFKHSCSEPKLDFYKRTKVLQCPKSQRKQLDSPESSISGWSVLGFYPPRNESDAAMPYDAERERENYMYDADLEESVGLIDSEIHGASDSFLQDSAGAQTSNESSNEDELGCLHSETEIYPHLPLAKHHSNALTVKEEKNGTAAQKTSYKNPFCCSKKEDSTKNDCIDNDSALSGKDAERTNRNTQENSLHMKQKRLLPYTHFSEQALAAWQLCCTGKSRRQHSVFRCYSYPSAAANPSPLDSIIQRMSSNILPNCSKPEDSLTHSDDQPTNEKRDIPQSSHLYATPHHCACCCTSKLLSRDLKTGVCPPECCHYSQVNDNQPAVSPCSESCGYSSTVQHVSSETEQNDNCCENCNQGSRQSGSPQSCPTSLPNVLSYSREDVNDELPATTSAGQNCASVDPQLGINNTNINGIGTGHQTSPTAHESEGVENAATTSGVHTSLALASAVDTVEEQFSQLQTHLELGVDSFKDYMLTLFSTLTKDPGPDKQSKRMKSAREGKQRASSISRSPCPLHRMADGSQPPDHNQHPQSTLGACPCCACHRCKIFARPCVNSPPMADASKPHSLGKSSCSCVEASHSRASQGSGVSVAWNTEHASGSKDVGKRGCRGTSHRAVLTHACSCHSRGTGCAERACIYRQSGLVASPHACKCHSVCKRKHTASPQTIQQTSSGTSISSVPSYCNHYRLCGLDATHCQKVKKEHVPGTTDKSRALSTPASAKYSISKENTYGAQSTLFNKEGNVPVCHSRACRVNSAQGEKTNTLGKHIEFIGEVTADPLQAHPAAENSGASNVEVFCERSEPSCEIVCKACKQPMYKAIDTNHSYRVTHVSSSVVDTAISLVETLLNMHQSQSGDPQLPCKACRRVPSSSVDGEVHSATMAENSAGSEDTSGRDILPDSVIKPNLDLTTSQFQAHRDDAFYTSVRSFKNNNTDFNMEEKCICHDHPLQNCCSACSKTSMSSLEHHNQGRNLALGYDEERQESETKRGGCVLSDGHSIATCFRCSHLSVDPNKSSSAITNDENKSNSSPSKCSTFLLCVGEEDGSSALVIQPLITPKTIQLRDTACQASDETLYDCSESCAVEWTTTRGNSDMSIASTSTRISTRHREETWESVDNVNHESYPTHRSALHDNPSRFSDQGCHSFSSIDDSVGTATDRPISSTSRRNRHRKATERTLESNSSSVHILQGTCEISHSSCETCLNSPGLQSCDEAAATCHKAEHLVSLRSETNVTENATNSQSDSGYRSKHYDTTNLCHTILTSNANKRKNGHKSNEHFCGKYGSFTSNTIAGEMNTAIDSVSEVLLNARKTTPEDTNWVSNSFVSESSYLDPIFTAKKIQHENSPVVRCKSSHVDPSITCVNGISLGHTESFCSDTCVDSLTAHYKSTDNNEDFDYCPSLINKKKGSQKRTNNGPFVELNISSFEENNHQTPQNMRRVRNGAVLSQKYSDSVGDHPNFPPEFNAHQIAVTAMSEHKEDKNTTETHTDCCLSLWTSQSAFTIEGTKFDSGRNHTNAPGSSINGLSTTAVTSSSSLTSSSSSPMDTHVQQCSMPRLCSETNGSPASALDCEAFASVTESAQVQKHAGMSASGIGLNNSRRCSNKCSGIAVRRSLSSSEQMCGKTVPEQSGARDSWVSLQLLNLSSRATRLAIESRLQSLQKILTKMENCANSPSPPAVSSVVSAQKEPSFHSSATSSVTLVAPVSPVPAPQKQTYSHSSASSSLTLVAPADSSSEAATAESSPQDHWLKACTSEELVQLIYLQLESLKSSTALHKQLQPSDPVESSAGPKNINTNHRSTRDTGTNIAADTDSAGTLTDNSCPGVFTGCLCAALQNSGIETGGASGRGVRVDVLRYTDVLNSVAQKRNNVRVDFQDDNSESYTALGNACVKEMTDADKIAINVESQIREVPSEVPSTNTNTILAPEVDERNITLDINDVKVDMKNYSDSCDPSRTAVVSDNGCSLKPDRAMLAESLDAYEPRSKDVISGTCRQKSELFDISDTLVFPKHACKADLVVETDLRTRGPDHPNSSSDPHITENGTSYIGSFDDIACLGTEPENLGVHGESSDRRLGMMTVQNRSSSSESKCAETKFVTSNHQSEPRESILSMHSPGLSKSDISEDHEYASGNGNHENYLLQEAPVNIVAKHCDGKHMLVHKRKRPRERTHKIITLNSHTSRRPSHGIETVSKFKLMHLSKACHNSKKLSDFSDALQEDQRNSIPRDSGLLCMKNSPVHPVSQTREIIKQMDLCSSLNKDNETHVIFVDSGDPVGKRGEVEQEEHTETSERDVFEDGICLGASARVEGGVKSTERGMKKGRVESGVTADDVKACRRGRNITSVNASVQCNIQSSSANGRSTQKVSRGHSMPDLCSAFTETIHALKSGNLGAEQEDAKTPATMREGTYHHEGGCGEAREWPSLLKRCRQRVRRLEQALDLERELHCITRASLRHLASDHETFRHQILRLQSRTARNQCSTDALRES